MQMGHGAFGPPPGTSVPGTVPPQQAPPGQRPPGIDEAVALQDQMQHEAATWGGSPAPQPTAAKGPPDPLEDVRAQLVAAGVPQVPWLRTVQTQVRAKTWFRPAVYTYENELRGAGWLIGQIGWRSNTVKRLEMGLPDLYEKVLTFMPAVGTSTPGPESFWPAAHCDGGIETYDTQAEPDMLEATTAVLNLLEQHRRDNAP